MTLQAIIEIVIMLLGAAICGFILAWLLFRNTKEEAEKLREEVASLQSENKKQQEAAKGSSLEKATLQQQIGQWKDEKDAVSVQLGEQDALIKQLQTEKGALSKQLQSEKDTFAKQLQAEKDALTALLQGEKDALAAQLQECRAEHGRIGRQASALQEQLRQCQEEKASMTVVAAPIARGIMAAAPTPEDLKIVEGIGPKIEQLFNKAGILTFLQLAEAPLERLQQILDEAGPRYQMHNPATWPRQALLAHEGKWEELKAYQDELNAGRE